MLSEKALMNVVVWMHAPPATPGHVRVAMGIAVKLDGL